MDDFLSEIYQNVNLNDFSSALALVEQHEFDLLEQYLGDTPITEFYQLLWLLTLACDEIPSLFHILKRASSLFPTIYSELYYQYTSCHYIEFLITFQQLIVPPTLTLIYEKVKSKLKFQVVEKLEMAYSSIPYEKMAQVFQDHELLERNWKLNREINVWFPVQSAKHTVPRYTVNRLTELSNMLIRAETL